MGEVIFRTYAGPDDLEAQYKLWLKATEGLPYAWQSNLRNVRALSMHVPLRPGARLYAERDGMLVGYIGTHAPLLWEGLGMAVPFGFPWTWPVDEGLEAELYRRMAESTPKVYPETGIDVFIERFRGSWARHLGFVTQRGWREAWREPILTREVVGGRGKLAAKVFRPADVPAAVALAVRDPHGGAGVTAESMRRGFENGWQEWERSWIVPGAGVFALEVRDGRAEVKLFWAAAGRLDEALGALEEKAGVLGAREVYFTLREAQKGRREPLEERGFRHVEDDVYMKYALRG